MSTHRGIAWLLLGACLASAGSAFAQDAYPTRPIRMYVGFAAGSATDVVARVISPKLGQRLGQPIVVENRTGAGGYIASELVVKSAPDGYSLLAVASAIATNPAVLPKMSFDTERDLATITLIGRLPTVLSVNSSVPANTLQEFIAYARANPGKINYGSSGTGGSTHLAAELFASLANVKLNHIPYRGNAPALAALIGGEIQMLIDNILGAVSSAGNPRVRTLAITTDQRSPLLPNVPTFAEAGLPAYKASIFFGVMGPAGLPPPVVDRLNHEILEVLKDEEVRSRLQQGGMDISGEGPKAFATLLRDEIAQWKRVVSEAGITATGN